LTPVIGDYTSTLYRRRRKCNRRRDKCRCPLGGGRGARTTRNDWYRASERAPGILGLLRRPQPPLKYDLTLRTSGATTEPEASRRI